MNVLYNNIISDIIYNMNYKRMKKNVDTYFRLDNILFAFKYNDNCI